MGALARNHDLVAVGITEIGGVVIHFLRATRSRRALTLAAELKRLGMGSIDSGPARCGEHHLCTIASSRVTRKGRADHEYAAFGPLVSSHVFPVDDPGAAKDFCNGVIECPGAR